MGLEGVEGSGMRVEWIRKWIPGTEAVPAGRFIGGAPEIPGTRPIKLEEHVILDTGSGDPTRHNFEARLLSKKIKDDLEKLNYEKTKILRAAWANRTQKKIHGQGTHHAGHDCHLLYWFENEGAHEKAHQERAEKRKAKAEKLRQLKESGLHFLCHA